MTTNLKFGMVAGVSCLLMAGLAAAMFAVSYESLAALAIAHGVTPSVAWLWPVSLDGLMVLVNLVRMRATLEGKQDKKAMIIMAAATAASVGLNVVHAPAGDIVGQVMFAIPPLVLWISSELTMDMVRDMTIARKKKLAARVRAAAKKAAST
jgi:hypothetical protein